MWFSIAPILDWTALGLDATLALEATPSRLVGSLKDTQHQLTSIT